MNIYHLDDIPDDLKQYFKPAPQIGLEPTPNVYVARMVEVFREVRRVLRSEGTCWVNLGDSYAATTKGSGGHNPKQDSNTGSYHESRSWKIPPGLKPKDLVGIPWRVALALQADGWWLRQDIIWAKPNPMPESVTDRCTKAHEYIFLLTKRASYFYDAEAIKEGFADERMGDPGDYVSRYRVGSGRMDSNPTCRPSSTTGRNARSVWTIPSQSYPEAHFATFPEALPRRCIQAGTSERGCCPACGAPWERVTEKTRTFESGSGKAGNLPCGKNGHDLQGGGDTGDIRRGPVVHATTTGWRPTCACPPHDPSPCTVMDIFCGSGTSGAVAVQLGRHFVGVELNAEYIRLAERRIGEAANPSTHRDMSDAADAPLFVEIAE